MATTIGRIALAALMASLCLALAIQMRSTSSSDPAPAARAAAPPDAPGASRESVEELQREIAELRSLVRVQIEAAKAAEAEASPSPAPGPDAGTSAEEEPDELQDLAARYARDSFDSRWALDSIAGLERSILDADIDGVSLTSLDCRSSLCRMELDVSPDASPERVTRQLVDSLGWEGSGRLQLEEGYALMYLERSPGL